mgnify:CR=1 FL=1
MEANELRIGNYVLDNSKNIKKVSNIFENTIYTQSAGKQFYYPITLTEEWLFNFGFEKLEGWDDLFYFQTGKFQVYSHNVSGYEYDGFNIKHVHQLQNLYFALTNKELTIK